MSSEPGVSSYDKIFGHLAECPEFKDVRANWLQRLEEVRFGRYEFSYEMVYGGRGGPVQEVATRYFASDGNRVDAIVDSGTERISYAVNGEFLLSDEEAEKVVRANFGTRRCKTYFCKVDKVLKGDDRRGHHRDGFAAWARKKLRKEAEGRIAEVEKAVVSEFKAVRKSDEYLADRKRFFERQVIEEIKKVVLKYFDRVDGAVIKEALDEVVAHAVMES